MSSALQYTLLVVPTLLFMQLVSSLIGTVTAKKKPKIAPFQRKLDISDTHMYSAGIACHVLHI